jgi:hypothetical protein
MNLAFSGMRFENRLQYFESLDDIARLSGRRLTNLDNFRNFVQPTLHSNFSLRVQVICRSAFNYSENIVADFTRCRFTNFEDFSLLDIGILLVLLTKRDYLAVATFG